MHSLLTLLALVLMIPAALAGFSNALRDLLARLDSLTRTLVHANAMLAEMAPMAPALMLLLAAVATLVVAGWMIVRTVNGGVH